MEQGLTRRLGRSSGRSLMTCSRAFVNSWLAVHPVAGLGFDMLESLAQRIRTGCFSRESRSPSRRRAIDRPLRRHPELSPARRLTTGALGLIGCRGNGPCSAARVRRVTPNLRDCRRVSACCGFTAFEESRFVP